MEPSVADRLKTLSLGDLWAGIERISGELDDERARVGLPVTPDEEGPEMPKTTDENGKLTPEAEAIVEASPEDAEMDKKLAEKLMNGEGGETGEPAEGGPTTEGGSMEQGEKAMGGETPEISPELMALADEHMTFPPEDNKKLLTAMVKAVGEAKTMDILKGLAPLSGPAAKGPRFRDEYYGATGRSALSDVMGGMKF